MDTLFDCDEPRALDRDRLRDRLSALASHSIFIGGSSWKYEGWLGQIYSRSRYQVGGRFSRKLFDESCLSQSPRFFPRSAAISLFISFRRRRFWGELFRRTPGRSAGDTKVPEQDHGSGLADASAIRSQAGGRIRHSSTRHYLHSHFLGELAVHREQVGVLIFEFGTLRGQAIETVADFVRALDPFLATLPEAGDTPWKLQCRFSERRIISRVCGRMK